MLLVASFASLASAHDTWVQTNTNVLRVGDVAHVDLMLGNHGNEHRDFKLASKISLDPCTLTVVAPDGSITDLKPKVVDLGSAPKEGFWSARFVPEKSGIHTVAHTLDTLHKTTRAIKSSKTFFAAIDSLDQLSSFSQPVDKPLGHPLELVLKTNPIGGIAPGQPIDVELLYEGKPLPEARITFIPRGQDLAEGFDENFERLTDADGRATFTPQEGNYYMAVVHHRAPEQKGDDYDQTAYSATMVFYVPQIGWDKS
ncbi:DUF4198 domain-containing protein [Bremerella cremea]